MFFFRRYIVLYTAVFENVLGRMIESFVSVKKLNEIYIEEMGEKMRIKRGYALAEILMLAVIFCFFSYVLTNIW